MLVPADVDAQLSSIAVTMAEESSASGSSSNSIITIASCNQ